MGGTVVEWEGRSVERIEWFDEPVEFDSNMWKKESIF